MGRPRAKVKRGFGEVGQLPSGRFRARYTGPDGPGGVLAAGLLAGLRQRRRAQFRARRPGRTIQAPRPELVPVENTVLDRGQAATRPTCW